MTTKEKQGFGLYFLLAFGMAWLLQVYASLLLLRDGNAAAYQLLLAVSMFCPLVSVLLVQKVLAASAHRHQLAAPPERQRQVSAGGMVRPGGVHRAGGAALLCSVFVPAGHLRQLAGHGLWRAVDTGSPENRAGSDHDQLPDPERSAGGHAGTVFNMIPAVGEEAGWRGYMMPHLKEQLGLLNGRLLGGVIWGVWHWPLMLLVGYEYGTNYLGAPCWGWWYGAWSALPSTLCWISFTRKRNASGYLLLRMERSTPLRHCRRC